MNLGSELEKKWLAGLFLAALVFAWNLKDAAPTISAGDSAELATAQLTLGVAHSPGYPLFVLGGKALSSLVPFGNPAYRANVFSVACAAAIALLCFWLFTAVTGSALFAFMATLYILAVPVMREEFLSAEVFALNTAFTVGIALCCWLALERSPQYAALAFFLLGLGLGNQHTLVFWAPALLVLTGLLVRDGSMAWPRAACLPLYALAGFSVYLFVPLRSLRQPLLDWEDPETFSRFWSLLTRARYGTFQLAQGEPVKFSWGWLWQRMHFFDSEVAKNTSRAAAFIISFGWLLSLNSKRLRRFSILLTLTAFLAGPCFLMMSNVGMQSGREILLRFLPMPFALFFILSALGWYRARLGVWLAFMIFWAIPFLPAAKVNSDRFLVHDYARAILQTLPQSSLVIMDRADEMEFALAYFAYTGQARKEVELIDANAGVTRSAYGDDYYRIWGAPRLERRRQVETELINSARKPVYYSTLEPQMIPQIPKSPHGLLYRADIQRPPAAEWERFYAVRVKLLEPGFRSLPIFGTYLDLIARDLAERGRFADAADLWHARDSIDRLSVSFHRLAILFFEKGRPDLAEDFFLKALERETEKDKILSNLGTLYEQTGSSARAEDAYKRAIQINPSSFQAHYNLGALYWKQGRWDRVVEQFEAVLRVQPDHTQARRFIAEARARLGRIQP